MCCSNNFVYFTGTSGRPLPVSTNYFHLEQGPDWHLYQYHVDYSPEIDSKKMRIAMLHDHDELLGRTRAFDGMTLYMPRKLQNQVCDDNDVTTVFPQ